MDLDSFIKLTDMLRVFVTPNPKAFKKDVISAEKRVALVIYYLKDQGSLRMIWCFNLNSFFIFKNGLQRNS